MSPQMPGSSSDAQSSDEASPRVSLSVNIVGGAPPPDFGKHAPHVDVAQLAKLEKQLMDHLKANPADAARFLTDPTGVLKKVAPKQTKLIAALAATRGAKAKVVAPAAAGHLDSVKVTVGKKRVAPRTPQNRPQR
jgi:hypothetical protein